MKRMNCITICVPIIIRRRANENKIVCNSRGVDDRRTEKPIRTSERKGDTRIRSAHNRNPADLI